MSLIYVEIFFGGLINLHLVEDSGPEQSA